MADGRSHHRHAERKELCDLFQAGRSIILLAPRRIGKTWLMDEVEKDLPKDVWRCIKIDVGGKSTEVGFLQALCTEIGKTRSTSENVLKHLMHKIQVATSGASPAPGSDLTTSLLDIVKATDHRRFLETLVEGLAKDHVRTLIMIDEFAYFVLRMAETSPEAANGAKDLLYHLRALQLANRKVQWFLTGSIGLDVVNSRFGFGGAFVDYDVMGLEPFTPDQARSYMHSPEAQPHPDRQFELSDPALDRLVTELGWLAPYYLRQIANRLKPTGGSAPDENRTIATALDIDTAIADLLKPHSKGHFETWPEHIQKNFPVEDRPVAMTLLGDISRASTGEQLGTLTIKAKENHANVSERQVKDVLINLEKDGFLARRSDRWAFRSGILRSYWLEYQA